MNDSVKPDTGPQGGGVTLRKVAVGAGFVVLLAAILWGYTDSDAPQRASTAAAVAAADSAPGPAMPALPAGPEAAAAPAVPDLPEVPGATGGPSATAPQSVAGGPGKPEVPAAQTPTPVRSASAVRGVVKAKDEVLFLAQMAGKIAQMPYREGDRFEKGELLVAFDCTRIRAEINAAWAANRANQQVLRQNLELDKYQAIGQTDVQIARAKAEQSRAEATALEAQVRDCTINAPFSGVVAENYSHLHENASPGKELTRVINDSELEVHLIAPSSWLIWLRPGGIFNFRVDETARSYQGKVARLGAAVDPVSQTVRVIGVLQDVSEGVLPGMSGSAEFPDNPARRAESEAQAGS